MKLGQEKLIKNRKILRAGNCNEKVLDAGSTFVKKSEEVSNGCQ